MTEVNEWHVLMLRIVMAGAYDRRLRGVGTARDAIIIEAYEQAKRGLTAPRSQFIAKG